MTTLETLAKAACEAALTKLGSSRPSTAWEDQSPQRKEVWIAATRAVVQAMRDPTDAMAMAAHNKMTRDNPAIFAGGIWRAMIDAILEEEHDEAVR